MTAALSPWHRPSITEAEWLAEVTPQAGDRVCWCGQYRSAFETGWCGYCVDSYPALSKLRAESQQAADQRQWDLAEEKRLAANAMADRLRAGKGNVGERKEKMSYDSDLKVFTDDEEWIVARSPEDAVAVQAELGATGIDPETFEECPPEKVFHMHDADGALIEAKTFAEWARSRGRGYLAGCV